MHDSRAVANKMLDIARDEGVRLTPMQLLKLLFFAQGWSLGLRGKAMFKHASYAWQYGPVVREVYWSFSKFGRSAISDKAVDDVGLPYESDFSEYEERLLRRVVAAYGRLHAFTLSDMTHEPGTPWAISYKEGARAKIDNKTIQEYFQGLAVRMRQ